LLQKLRFLVIGFGSIGEKHYQELKKYSSNIDIVSKHLSPDNAFHDIDEIDDLNHYSHIFLCNNSSEHQDTYYKISQLGFNGTLFIEKPTLIYKEALIENVYVGYDLRFSNVFKYAVNNFQSKEIKYINIYCGQHLSQWRSRDYRKTSSSSITAGGGVINDLSHEIDFMLQFIDDPCIDSSRIFHNLNEIETESYFHGNFFSKSTNTIVNLTINYHDHIPSRYFSIHTDDSFVRGDFLANEVNHDNKVIKLQEVNLLNSLHEDLFGEKKFISTLQDSMKVDKLIKTIKEYQ